VGARAGWVASLLVLLAVIGAGGWIGTGRARARLSRPRVVLSWWVVAGALFLVVVVSWGATSWLLHLAAQAKDVAAAQVDAIKTGLGIGAGTGGVFALLLAVRRQWHQELSAADTVLDATERRVTELYTKAVEQLGSDKAPVRLGGLYALERLAQTNPTQRQTVVNVVCAYLRMPYEPPDQTMTATGAAAARRYAPPGPVPAAPRQIAERGEPAGSPENGSTRTASPQGVEVAHEWERRTQEREVRIAAQTILARHLRPGPDHPERPAATFWPDIDLDLTGAFLTTFGMYACHVRSAHFEGARFAVGVGFQKAYFAEIAVFQEAHFLGSASFREAYFGVGAAFGRARFAGRVVFEDAEFDGPAGFPGTRFGGGAAFARAYFGGLAGFEAAEFDGPATFEAAEFDGPATFEKARFSDAHQHALPPGMELAPAGEQGWRAAVPARRPREPDPTDPAPAIATSAEASPDSPPGST
jgi:hypothetical protein